MSLVCRTDITAHAKTLGRTDWFPSVCRMGRHSRKMLEQVLKVSEGQGCFRGPCAGSSGHGREGKKTSFLSGRQPGSQNFPEVLSVNSQTPPLLHPILGQLPNLKNMLQPAQDQGKSGHIIRNPWLPVSPFHPGLSAIKLLGLVSVQNVMISRVSQAESSRCPPLRPHCPP